MVRIWCGELLGGLVTNEQHPCLNWEPVFVGVFCLSLEMGPFSLFSFCSCFLPVNTLQSHLQVLDHQCRIRRALLLFHQVLGGLMQYKDFYVVNAFLVLNAGNYVCTLLSHGFFINCDVYCLLIHDDQILLHLSAVPGCRMQSLDGSCESRWPDIIMLLYVALLWDPLDFVAKDKAGTRILQMLKNILLHWTSKETSLL